MPFTQPPRLAYMGRGKYQTVGPTLYQGSRETILIDSGFPTDLASVPRAFWALLPPDGTYENAAVVHDHGCVELADAYRLGRRPAISSRDNDGLFRRIAREGGTGWVARWHLWMGVRLGALANPARRAGWLRDAPLVGLIAAADLTVLATCLRLLAYVFDAIGW